MTDTFGTIALLRRAEKLSGEDNLTAVVKQQAEVLDALAQGLEQIQAHMNDMVQKFNELSTHYHDTTLPKLDKDFASMKTLMQESFNQYTEQKLKPLVDITMSIANAMDRTKN